MINNSHKAQLVKKDGKLVYRDSALRKLYNEFVSSLKEGEIVDVYMEASDNDKSNAQLAKIHAMIKTIAEDSGNNFTDIKEHIKKISGLEDKSFADCSKKELSMAINSAIEFGDFFGINLR